MFSHLANESKHHKKKEHKVSSILFTSIVFDLSLTNNVNWDSCGITQNTNLGFISCRAAKNHGVKNTRNTKKKTKKTKEKKNTEDPNTKTLTKKKEEAKTARKRKRVNTNTARRRA